MSQTKEQIKYQLGVSSHRHHRSNKDDDELESMKDTEASWDITCLCTYEVLMARQAYDLIQSHIERLHEDLGLFTEDFKHERKIPPNQPPLLSPVPVVSMDVKRRLGHLALVHLKHQRKLERGNGTSMLTLQEQDLDEP